MDPISQLNKALDDRDMDNISSLSFTMSEVTYIQAIVNKLCMTDDVDLFRFLHKEKFANIFSILCYEELFITSNNVNIVKYLSRKDMIDYRYEGYVKMAVKTSLEMTKVMLSRYRGNCDIYDIVHLSANIDIAKYLVEELGAKVGAHTIYSAISLKRKDLLPYLISKYSDIFNVYELLLIDAVAFHEENERLDFIEYVIELGAIYSSMCLDLAIHNEHLDLITFFHQKGYKISNNIYSTNDNILNYLHEHKLGIYEKCNPNCERCYQKKKIDDIIDTWYMESLIYKSVHQWLPREMLEDVIGLTKVATTQVDISRDLDMMTLE